MAGDSGGARVAQAALRSLATRASMAALMAATIGPPRQVRPIVFLQDRHRAQATHAPVAQATHARYRCVVI
jgi:hypothetical protein